MKYREFGKTGWKVSEVGFGAWAIGGNEHGNSYGQTDDKVSMEAINRALDLGCNFIDTADVYGWGHSEDLIGRAIKNKRDRLIIATKVGADFYQGPGFQTFTQDYIRFALEKSLARLRTDYIDVYQLHNPPLKLLTSERTYDILKEFKKEGKIRAWGVSIFDPVEGLSALKVGQPDSLQVTYNIFTTRAAEELLPMAQKVGCAIIAREPLANGFITGKFNASAEFEKGDMRNGWRRDFVRARIAAAGGLKFLEVEGRSLAQSAVKYVLTNSAVCVAVTGTKTPEQADENCVASECPALSLQELARIRQLQEHGFNLL